MSSFQSTVNIPIQATYRIVNGESVKISEIRADVPIEDLIALLSRIFGLNSKG